MITEVAVHVERDAKVDVVFIEKSIEFGCVVYFFAELC